MDINQHVSATGIGGIRANSRSLGAGESAARQPGHAEHDECGCERLDNGECGCLRDRIARGDSPV
jgi:hypothetical protein